MIKSGENTYIMNLEACYIYKDITEEKKITYKNRDLTKLFSATMPYSLEAMRINDMFPDSFYTVNGKQYTRKIINLTFDKNYSVWDDENKKRTTIATRKKIRKYIYENGFFMDGEKYVFYKRGAGKAKNGYALFIQENMREPLITRSRVGLNFKENEEVDLTSLLAYESLVSSGIIDIINLNPLTEILLIDDIYGKEFDGVASITTEKNKEITTKNETLRLQNCLTDGQGLIDESVFEKHDKSNKGFMLLRSDMFKCCAFNTKLQEWFKHNNIEKLTDMFGRSYDASKIKLVATPNSLKFLKFAYKFTNSETKNEFESLKDKEQTDIKIKCYEYWLNNIDNIFGVVKYDKEGNYGSYNRLTYQLINSIPDLTFDDLMDITKIERDYVTLLKNDNAVFKNYLGCNAKASLKLERCLEEGDISLYENTDLMNALIMVNPDIQYTKKFKKMKSDLIGNYVGHLKEGKIRLEDSKYVTLVSNPYEMLLACIGEYRGKSIMVDREVYCPYYDNNQEFCGTRNPHINAGNVMHTKNVYHKEYSEWFNFTDNICAINFFDNDAPDRLQGCDTDSDTMELNKHEILIEKAKQCEKIFATPINRVKGRSKPKKYNMAELQKLDDLLCNNYIGKIVNMSQIINSYMNDAVYKKESFEIIDELYQASSRLSSMSQIEIDKSKKVFDNISMSKELAKMRKIEYIRHIQEEDKYGQLADKMVVPNFFKIIANSNEYRVFEKFNTPLDILQDVLVFEGGNRLKGEKHKDLIDLLVKTKELEGIYQINSAKAVKFVIEKCGKKINGLKLKTCTLNEKAKKTVEKKAKHEAVEELKKLKPNEATILSILKQSFGTKEEDKLGFKKYSMLTLNLLFTSKKIQVLKCFKSNDINIDEVLIKIKDECDFNIFGKKYQKVERKDFLQ